MKEASYEFDPCELDGSKDDEEVTLDNWEKTAQLKVDEIVQSQWRKDQIGTNFDQEPGLDDLRKIESYVKKKKSDAEIMRVFGINAKTMLAIKEKRYCPMDSISQDNLSKISAEFRRLSNEIKKITLSNEYIAKHLFKKKSDMDKYKKFCNLKLAKMRKENEGEIEPNDEVDDSEE